MDRRKFCQLGAAGIVSSFATRTLLAAASAQPKFSYMLWALPKPLTIDQRLEIVAKAGYTGAELVLEWMNWSDAERKRVAALAKSLGITLDIMFPGRVTLSDPAAKDTIHEQLAKAIPVAKEMGCPQLGYASGPRIEGQSPEQRIASITENLKFAADILAKEKMELLLEPIDLLEDKRAAINSVSDAFTITRAVGSPWIKVLYDFYHEQRGAGNLIEKLEQNIDQVGLVHIADVPGRHHPGTGEMNYEMIYRALARLGYNRYIAMEFYPQGDAVTELKTAREEVLKAFKG